MWFYLVALFILLPWLEALLLFRLGGILGFPATLGVILFTGVVGASLARQQGVKAVQRIKTAVEAGRMPATEVVDGVLILAAGLLLITPGFISDSVGFLLLIAPARGFFRRALIAYFKRQITIKTSASIPFEQRSPQQPQRPPDSDVIDVEARVLPSDDE